MREATKGMHGKRPAVLMIQAVRQIARGMGCSDVLLVSHRLRVALNPMRRRKLTANLERLWLELGAQVTSQGFFMLSPYVPVPHDFSDVASNKRSEARRKAELLQNTLHHLDQKILALLCPSILAARSVDMAANAANISMHLAQQA